MTVIEHPFRSKQQQQKITSSNKYQHGITIKKYQTTTTIQRIRRLVFISCFTSFFLFLFVLILVPTNEVVVQQQQQQLTTASNNQTRATLSPIAKNNGNTNSQQQQLRDQLIHFKEQNIQKLQFMKNVFLNQRQRFLMNVHNQRYTNPANLITDLNHIKDFMNVSTSSSSSSLFVLNQLSDRNVPARLRALRSKHEIVGERLMEIKYGTGTTVQEIIHGHDLSHHDEYNNNNNNNINNNNEEDEDYKSSNPMQLNEIIHFLTNYLHELQQVLISSKHATFEGVWDAYHDITIKTLYPWDREYLHRMPHRRDHKVDDSIFLSIASYRDDLCPTTLYEAYRTAAKPESLYVGLIQQNCFHDCKSGVLANLTMVDVPPDPDCYALFCATDFGSKICMNQQIRVLNLNESESLGPYAARYFASKLWYGEPWYMQIDAHMTFAQNWDEISLNMLQLAPSSKPVLSHYPPSNEVNLTSMKEKQPTSRLCGPVFATSDLEEQIIRLEESGVYDTKHLSVPAFAPFTAAGYFVAHSSFLRDVPFDPFLPWIFMGEEIIMSTRLWTAGYDIFAPNQAVVGHYYVRRHRPKFWESVHRTFTPGIHNPLQGMVLQRIKYQLLYPESDRDMIRTKSILTAVEQYGMGHTRSLTDYFQMVGINTSTKEITYTEWCEKGYPPPGFDQYDSLYPNSYMKQEKNEKKNQQQEAEIELTE